jgi:uncharacterized protein YihD (DUF1040 family)
MFTNYYDFGVAPSYKQRPTTQKRKRNRKLNAYSVNDGRAPDCNKAIFGKVSKAPVVKTEQLPNVNPEMLPVEQEISEYFESSLDFDELEDLEERRLIYESIQDSENEEEILHVTESYDEDIKTNVR